MGWTRAGALAGLLLAFLASASEAALDKDALKMFGGTYLSDCKNPASPRVTVFEDQLVFIKGDTRIAIGNVQNAASYFGNSPPENYDTVLLGENAGGSQMMLIVYRDEAGPYITIDADAKYAARIGKPAMKLKYRRCGEAPKRAEAAPKPKAAPVELDAGLLMEDPAFKSAYRKALGGLAREPWLAALDGPGLPVRKVTVAGTEYLLVSVCKTHDCHENNTTLLYAAGTHRVYGKARLGARSALYGTPPPAVAKELGEYWRKEWGTEP
jgi:hypothetical protein